MPDHPPIHEATPAQGRALIRSGQWQSRTGGLAERHVQGNLVIVPQAQADDFLRYCQRNPKPCPLLAVGFNLFVLQGLTKRDITWISRQSVPLFVLMLAFVLMLWFVPGIATWMPSHM